MANQGKGNTADAVRRIAQPIADSLGLTLWDVRFVREGADWFLRIFIDKEGGVSLDDCEAMSRALDEPLDEADPISHSYCLEVSSPGIERELTRPEHFERMASRPVRVRLIRPDASGKRELEGTLVALAEGRVVLAGEDGETRAVPMKEISSVRLTEAPLKRPGDAAAKERNDLER